MLHEVCEALVHTHTHTHARAHTQGDFGDEGNGDVIQPSALLHTTHKYTRPPRCRVAWQGAENEHTHTQTQTDKLICMGAQRKATPHHGALQYIERALCCMVDRGDAPIEADANVLLNFVLQTPKRVSSRTQKRTRKVTRKRLKPHGHRDTETRTHALVGTEEEEVTRLTDEEQLRVHAGPMSDRPRAEVKEDGDEYGACFANSLTENRAIETEEAGVVTDPQPQGEGAQKQMHACAEEEEAPASSSSQ